MSTLGRSAIIAAIAIGTSSIPVAARAEHCAGANYVDGLEPEMEQTWIVGTEQSISWLVGSSCGLMTYQVEISRDGQPYEVVGTTEALFFDGRFEFPWQVTGPAGVQVRFRVHRVLSSQVTPYAVTAPIDIKVSVPTQKISWSALRAKF